MNNQEVLLYNTNFEKHKISVIIPAYNAAQTIIGVLDSIGKQTLKELEVIVVDDGSTDSTRMTVMSYIDQNPQMDIVYIYQENAGPGVARNVGIEHATGEYIAFSDADDQVPPGAYHSMYYTAQYWDCDIVIGSYMRQIDGGKWYVPQYIQDLCIEMESKNCAGNYQIVFNNPSLWNRLYRRSFLNENKIRFLNELHGEDKVFNLDTVQKAKTIYTTEAVTYLYRKQSSARQSLSTSWSYKNTSSCIRTTKTYLLFFDSIGDIDSETTYIATEFKYLLDGIRNISDNAERDKLFEEIKELLRLYAGNKKYENLLSLILGVDLSTTLLLPFESYLRQKRMIYSLRTVPATPQPQKAIPTGNYKEIVLNQFINGEIGFRYIFKYMKGWIRYKLSFPKRKK